MFEAFTPKFVKQYCNLSPIVLEVMSHYVRDVREGVYPEEKHSFKIPDESFQEFVRSVG